MGATLWTKDDSDLAVRLWAEGWTAQQISTRINGRHSRNSVIGHVHRRNIRQGSAVSSNTPRKPKPEPLPKPKPEPEPVRVSVPAMITPSAPKSWGGKPVSLLDVRDGQCRWPVSDAPNFKMCGAPTDGPTKAFCPDHHKHAFQVMRPYNPKPYP